MRGAGCCCSAARGRWVVRFEDSTTVALRGERVRTHQLPDMLHTCVSSLTLVVRFSAACCNRYGRKTASGRSGSKKKGGAPSC